MGTPLGSVVVPIYNTAPWLPAALASLRRQRLRDRLEAILVDDGSTDGSRELARAYAGRTPGVRYVHQTNAGLGAARNHGLRLATGRYLGFLDSDDYYPKHGLDRLLAAAGRHDAAVVVGDMHGVPPRQSPPWRRELTDHPYPRVVGSIGEAPDLVGNPSPCNKVFARELVAQREARFTEGMAFEDVLFTLPLLLHSDRTVIIPELVYLYRRRGDGSSIMDNRSQPIKIMQHLAVIEELMARAAGADPAARRAVARWTAYMQLHYAGRAAGSLDEVQFAEFCGRMATLFRQVPVAAAREYAGGVKAALRAVAIYEHDLPGVRDGVTRAALRVAGGRVYAGGADLDRYRSLLELTPVRATLTGLQASGRELELRGRCTVPQLRVAGGEPRTDLVIELAGAAVPLVSTAARTTDVWFRCPLDPDRLEVGRHPLRFAVRDGADTAYRPVRLGSRSQPVALPDGRWVWLTTGPRLAVAARRPLLATAGPVLLGPVERGAARARGPAVALARPAARYARRALRSARRLRSRVAARMNRTGAAAR